MPREVAAVVDVDISDEAAGRARVEKAAASKARKEADARLLAQQNAEMRHRNATTAQRTDDDIMDEEAGRARLAKAAASKARRVAEARALAHRNAEMRRRTAEKSAATDFDISDDPAGRARIELAKATKARKEAEAALLAHQNAEMRQRNESTALRTDSNIMDEAAGKARIKLAMETKRLREVETRLLAQNNAELRRRIKARQTRKRGDAMRKQPVHRPDAEEAEKLRAESAAEDEAAELKLLRAMLERSSVAEKKEEGWNSSPYRPVPYALRGMRPMHTMEPWAKGVIDQAKESGYRAGATYATATLSRLDDGLNDSYAMLHRRRLKEDAELSEATSRQAWDNTVWRYCPPAFRGLNPVTPEPWLRDLEAYRARDLPADAL